MSNLKTKREKTWAWWLSLLVMSSWAVLSAAPAWAATAVVGGLTRETTSRVGETYRGVVVLKNDGDEPQEVKLYQTDYMFNSEGTTFYGEPGKLERSNADWVSFSPSRLTIPAKGSAGVDYTVEVPDDKSMTGTYWSILMVEPIGSNSPEATYRLEAANVSVGIREVTRLGIQVVTHIGDTGKPRPYFLRARLTTKQDSTRVLCVDLENRGERWMIPTVWAEAYDEEGRLLGSFQGGKKRIYPGTSVRYETDLSNLPEGSYRVLVVADAGNDQVFGANYTLKLHKAPTGE